jgi:diguanylate cyclase (GGDEF)-like protein/PAS domain S-box-containing protein
MIDNIKELEKLKIVSRSSPQIIVRDGVVDYINSMAMDLFGIQDDEVILGKKIISISPSIQLDGEKTIEYYEKIVNRIREVGESFFKWVIILDSEPIFLEMHGLDISKYINDGMLFTLYDITMWTKFTRMFYDQGLNSSFYEHEDILLLIDGDNGDIIDCNQSATRFYKYSYNQLKSMNIKKINTDDEVKIQEKIDAAKIEKDNHFVFNHRIGDDTVKRVKVHSRPIRIEGKNLLCSLVIPDSLNLEIADTEFLECYINSVSIPIAVTDGDGNILECNSIFKNVVKDEIDDSLGLNLVEVLSLDSDYYFGIDKIEDFVKSRFGKVSVKIKDIHYNVEKFSVAGLDGQSRAFITFNDQSKIIEMRKKIESYEKIMGSVSVGLVITDKENKIKWVNKGFEKITGYSFEEALGNDPNILKSDEHKAEFYQRMWNSINLTGRWSGEIINKNKAGENYIENIKIIRFINSAENEVNHIGIFNDISEEKKKSREIWNLSYKDTLTGLNNRNYFIDRLEYELKFSSKYNEKIALILVDIENFKSINTVMGIKFGDMILKKFAEVLKNNIPFNGSISRFDGDEFIILISNIIDVQHVTDFIDELNHSIKNNLHIENKPFHIDYNIGISLYPDDGDDPFELVNKCEIAKNKVKSLLGQNYIFYKDTFKREINKKHHLTKNLKEALLKKELYIVFQPIVDVKNSKVHGFEVLLRWNSQNLGRVHPEDFIEIAESSGDIVEIGFWIMEKSFEALKDIDHSCDDKKSHFLMSENIKNLESDVIDDNFFISINLSLIQIENVEFVERIKEIVDKYQIDTSRVEFEITESVLSKNYFSVKDKIDKLLSMGFRIAIDDFGTGYSSFSLVKMMNISKIKIDKFFLQDFFEDETYKEILETIILMGKNLKLHTVVEGVETEEHLEFLKSTDADYYQGFYYSKPKEIGEFFLYYNEEDKKEMKDDV